MDVPRDSGLLVASAWRSQASPPANSCYGALSVNLLATPHRVHGDLLAISSSCCYYLLFFFWWLEDISSSIAPRLRRFKDGIECTALSQRGHSVYCNFWWVTSEHFWLVRRSWVGQPNPLRHSFWNLQTSAIAIGISSLVYCFFFFLIQHPDLQMPLVPAEVLCAYVCMCVMLWCMWCWLLKEIGVDLSRYDGVPLQAQVWDDTEQQSHVWSCSLSFFFLPFFFLWGLVRRYRFLIYFKQADVLTLFFFYILCCPA